MRTPLFALASLVTAAVSLPAASYAQGPWVPGSEILGQPLQVETNGVVNTVYLEQGGTARIVTPAGATTQGTWSIANQQLCLTVGAQRECWPYTQAFQAGQQVTLTSNCQATSRWLAASTNPPPEAQGERG